MGKRLYKIGRHLFGRWLSIRYARNLDVKGRLTADLNTKLILDSSARININGQLELNQNCIKNNGRSTILRMDKHTVFTVCGNSRFYYDGDIILFPNAKFSMGDSFINSNCKIRCHEHISIGNGCVISHDCTIMDSDAHYLNGDNHTEPVEIGNHVWIGTRVVVLSGVKIGDGAVIAAGALVNSNIPAYSMAAGVPARVIKEKVEWSI